ncbi:MAG: DNA alkylation repair protein [DPANN group archaeon]|nr:DNA alkylation repair protein [DPANN group archaeon]
MDTKTIRKWLRKNASEKDRLGMIRFGIRCEKGYGVSIWKLRKLAKEIGKDHKLSMQLYKQAEHEMKLLGCLVAEPDKMTEKQMDTIVRGFYSWDLCDQWCSNVLDKTPFAWKKAKEYARADDEFVRRAGFVLMCTLAVHDKKRDDRDFLQFFPSIRKYAFDERNFVKKAVNWAIRQIGKRSRFLNKEAVRLAKEVKKQDTKAARWIADGALRELTSEKTVARLK